MSPFHFRGACLGFPSCNEYCQFVCVMVLVNPSIFAFIAAWIVPVSLFWSLWSHSLRQGAESDSSRACISRDSLGFSVIVFPSSVLRSFVVFCFSVFLRLPSLVG